MGYQLNIEGDEIEFVKVKDGRHSLNELMAESNVKMVNALSVEELFAVFLAVKMAPFPLGTGEQVYRRLLDAVRTEPAKVFTGGTLPDMPLGKIRHALVVACGSGCNAPNDSYLTIAYQIKQGEPVTRY